MNCLSCNKPLKSGAKFCTYCGANQEELRAKEAEAKVEKEQRERKAREELIKQIKPLVIGTFVLAALGFGGWLYFVNSNADIYNSIDPNKSYSQLRKEILSSGKWKVYIRNNEFTGWKKPFPELDFCDEDYCVASFISSEGNKVRKIGFGYCSSDRYIQCPGKPNGFQEVEKDITVSKSKSDKEFLEARRRFEN